MKGRLVYFAGFVFLATPLAFVQCGSDGDASSVFDSSAGEGGGSSNGGGNGGSSGNDPPVLDTCDGGPCGDARPAPAGTCGDGTVGGGEACDDGNTRAGDGCSATCALEAGWACPLAGLRCEAARCGDGLLAGTEECESKDGGAVVGCTATCRIAAGFDCDPVALTCARTVCGDGKVARGESCEDGNDLPFDGCYKCQKEPSCTAGVCQASCGDGQRFASEACDDGNTRDGDGCSATCMSEKGFACTDVVAAPPPVIDLPIVIRDFIGQGNAIDGGVAHIDYNKLTGNGVLGIVESRLGANGRPVFACPLFNGVPDCTKNPGRLFTNAGDNRPNMSTPANFAQWYTNVPGVNLTSVISVPLRRQAAGTYLWNSGNLPDGGAPGAGDGEQFFDPVHDGGWVAAGKEQRVCTPARNVSFSSETHFWFEYLGGEAFAFSGDDDTWVFINGRLAIDLGGLHGPLGGDFVLDADTDGVGPDTADGKGRVKSDKEALKTVDFGLVRGGVYDVVMFQAERNQCGSNFKVTLKDFNRPKSACASTCGDGIVASDEACDDAKNDGAYGHCMPGCKARGPRCGDGKLDSPQEECDDGNTVPDDACSNACFKRRVQ